MSNSYYQVCRTYVRQCFASWPIFICIAANVPGLIAATIAPRMTQHGYTTCYVMSTGFLGYLIWLHFRQQIIDQRRFILPNFLRPQTLAFATYAGFLFCIVPVEMIWWGGFHSIGLLALAVAFCAAFGWCVATLSFLLFLLTWIAWMSTMWDFMSGQLAAFISGQFETQAYALLAIGLVASIGAVVRLCRMTEENPTYRRRFFIDPQTLRSRMTGDQNTPWPQNRWWGFGAALGRRSFARGGGLWRRAWSWSTLGLDCALVVSVIMPTIIAVLRFMPGIGPTGELTSMLLPLFVSLSFLHTVLISPRWMQVWRFLEPATLFPLDRESFLKQIGLAIAINFVEAWISSSAVFVGLTLLLAPAPINWSMIWSAVAAAAAIQILSYGVCLWLLRFRSVGWFFVGGVGISAALAILAMLAAWLLGDGFDLQPLVLSALPAVLVILAFLGIVIAIAAARWWRIAELG